MSKLKKNLGYQIAYEILNVALPLITAPFLARVLGAEALGIMSYTSSIVSYFTLFAMMGLKNYGTRSIAFVRNNPEERNNTFSQIYCLQLITSGIAFIAYGIYMFGFCKENIIISWIQGISVLACFLDISWFFFGIEEFKITVIRSMIIRVASVVLMLILVRDPSDLWLYAVLIIGSTFCSQAVLWFYLPKYVKLTKQKLKSIKKHVLPNIHLFVPIVAMTVYHLMDKTMLGAMSTYTQSGYYYNADKVINIPVSVLIGIISVLLPRLSVLISEDKTEEFDAIFKTSIRTISLISSAMCCGIAAVSKEFTPVFFGNGYDECVILIVVLAPTLFIKGLSAIARNLFLIPKHMEKEMTKSVFIGAFVNLVVNFLLIPNLGALGAVIGSLVAEAAACLFLYRYVTAKLKCVKSILLGITYFGIGVVMYFCVRFIADQLVIALFPKLVIEIIAGAIIYCVLCVLFWVISKNKEEMDQIKSLMKR